MRSFCLNVQIDVLDDILSTIRVEGTIYFQKTFTGDWGIAVPATPFKKFHIMADGQAWLRASFLPEPVLLNEGDIIAFPQGDAYQLSATPETRCQPEISLWDAENLDEQISDADAPRTTIVSGHIAFLRQLDHPFVRNLPRLLHVNTHEQQYRDWLQAIVEMLIAETKTSRPGTGSVIKRLAEVLHLYTLRAYILSQQKAGTYTAVFNDPSLYRALQLIHGNLAVAWTLADLAQEVGMSRTLFATRFHDLVGVPPMRYITHWRMQKAHELLETTNLTLAIIAEEVGYQSEAAFNRAFKREFGLTPGKAR